jgi:trans-2,3-dihydro-3-hydroxyanthranilic acid synthase
MAGIPQVAPYPLPGKGDLPGNIAGWAVDPSRAVLLIHDMQSYFLRPLPPSLRADLIGNVALVLAYCREHDVQVAYTQQPGDMDVADRGLLKDFWGQGMAAKVVDRQVVTPLTPREGDWVFTKWRYSAFFRSRLLDQMRERGRDQIVICGVYAHVGVLTTAIDAFSHDIETFVVADAVADFSPQHHRQALEHASRCCAVVTTVQEILVSPARNGYARRLTAIRT